jgi:hypothetical protein
MKFMLLAAMLLSPFVHAADYNGTWLLDKEKSSGLPPLYQRVKSHTLVTTRTPRLLNVQVEVDIGLPEKDRINLAYPLDGSVANTQTKIRMQQGLVDVPTTLQATADAQGGMHIAVSRTVTMGGQQTVSDGTEDWRLSPDGKTLTIHRIDNTPRGRMEFDMVFLRQ